MCDKLTDAEIAAIKLSMPNDIIIRKLLAEREAMQEEAERLRKVLAPFATASQYMTAGKACDPSDLGIWADDTSGCRITVADFQRAAQAATDTQKGGA